MCIRDSYYTDIFGLAPLAVGTMMLVLRIFDAVIDPAVGLSLIHI